MPDWKKIVREKLGSLPLNGRPEEEVIDELAQQLESAYEEAIAAGADEPEATRRSLAQFTDWEKLRSDVFSSVEGTQLPIWEQRGAFAPRRWPVWIAIALSLALLLVPAFRQALAIFPVPGRDVTAWNSRVFSEKALRRIEESGDKQKYARTLAFVALHNPDDLQAVRAAEKAIALDPQLTWISAPVSHATYLMPGYDPHPWIERLKAWDPQNAFPYLLEASASVHGDWEKQWAKYNAPKGELRKALAAEPAWRNPMEKAFAAPRMDFYWPRQFALDRQVLQEQGLDRPDMLTAAAWSQQLPELFAIKIYENIQLEDVGKGAEEAGHTEEALAAYWTVARFGERLPTEPKIMQLVSVKLRKNAYSQIIPLLQRKGHVEEAAAIQAALSALPVFDPDNDWRYNKAFEVTAGRSARIVQFTGFSLIIFGSATVLWLISVIVLRWKRNLSRGLNRVASVLCFAPPFLFISAFTFLVAYYPYAQPIGKFGSQEELISGYVLFLTNIYDLINFGLITDVWLTHMFWPVVWCAAIALAGALLLWWVGRRDQPDRTGVA